MAKTTVYDLENVAHEMETVDARECCQEMGWSMTPIPEGPTREAMKSFLTAANIQFPANIKNDKLVELYTAEKAKFGAE